MTQSRDGINYKIKVDKSCYSGYFYMGKQSMFVELLLLGCQGLFLTDSWADNYIGIEWTNYIQGNFHKATF